MKRILITGSRGFIGSHLRSMMPTPYDYDEADLSIGISHKDIRGREGTLVFLSGWSREGESYTNPSKYIENNISDLAELLVNNSFNKVIFSSSQAVYDKNGNLNPKSVYGITKLAGEHLIKLYAKEYWILRIANPFGTGDKRSVFYHLAQCKKQNRMFSLYKLYGRKKDYFGIGKK